jgi:hypothetical protein
MQPRLDAAVTDALLSGYTCTSLPHAMHYQSAAQAAYFLLQRSHALAHPAQPPAFPA